MFKHWFVFIDGRKKADKILLHAKGSEGRSYFEERIADARDSSSLIELLDLCETRRRSTKSRPSHARYLFRTTCQHGIARIMRWNSLRRWRRRALSIRRDQGRAHCQTGRSGVRIPECRLFVWGPEEKRDLLVAAGHAVSLVFICYRNLTYEGKDTTALFSHPLPFSSEGTESLAIAQFRSYWGKASRIMTALP